MVGDAAFRAILEGKVAVDLLMAHIKKSIAHSQLNAEAIDWPSGCLQELQGRDLSFWDQIIKGVSLTILYVLAHDRWRELEVITTQNNRRKRVAPDAKKIQSVHSARLIHCNPPSLLFFPPYKRPLTGDRWSGADDIGKLKNIVKHLNNHTVQYRVALLVLIPSHVPSGDGTKVVIGAQRLEPSSHVMQSQRVVVIQRANGGRAQDHEQPK